MRLDLYGMVKDDAGVQSALGAEPRFYPFGEAPQASVPDGELRESYATWQSSAIPQNVMDGRPDMDDHRTQIDVWAPQAVDADQTADAIRDALEPLGHQVSLNFDGRDPETRLYRISFDFEFWQSR